MGNPSVVAVYQSAQLKFLAGDSAQAHCELRSAVEINEDSGELWELLGQVCYTKGRINEALDAFEHASLLIPLSARGQFILGRCYEYVGQDMTAIAIYQHLATIRSLESDLLEPLARALGRADQCEAALRVCRDAANRFPEAPEPLMGIVFFMRRLCRPVEQILPCLFRAHHLDPEDVDCRVTLAWLLHECGRSVEAAHYLSVIPLEEFRCGNCLTGMKAVFSAAGDQDNARRCADSIRARAESSE